MRKDGVELGRAGGRNADNWSAGKCRWGSFGECKVGRVAKFITSACIAEVEGVLTKKKCDYGFLWRNASGKTCGGSTEIVVSDD